MEVKSEKFITSAHAQKILDKRSKEGELNYEQKNAYDYLNRFVKASDSSTESLLGDLAKIEKLQERHIVGIVEMLPKSDDDLRLLFANERTVLSDDEKKQILDAVKKHSK